MSEIPESWAEVRFRDINTFTSRSVDPSAYPEELFELYSVPTFPTRKPEMLLGREIGSTKQVVEPDDVLVCKINPRINRVWQVMASKERQQIASSEWIVMRAPGLCEGFLRHYFTSPAFRELICNGVTGVGGSLTRAQPKRVAEFPVPIAPLPEQNRIADKLDWLLARVDACCERVGRIPDILKRFRQSVLTAGTNGELTRGWREGRGASADSQFWSSETLADLCINSRALTYGVIKLGEETPNGVPCLRTSNVRWLKIDTVGMKRIAPQLSAEYGRTVLQGGEVLVNVRGTLGGVAVADETMRGWNVSREVAVVPADTTRINSHFLAFWIGSDKSQKRLQKFEKGVAYTGINLEDLRTLPVEVPPLDEQSEIVLRVQRLLELADQLESRHNAAFRIAESMASSLLTMAFHGELVPQDPTDEPATELLAKIEIDKFSKTVERSRMRKVTKRKQTDMSNTGKEAIKAAIMSMHSKAFSFEDLRARVSEDYESLKATVFGLLEEPEPIIRQVFNKKAEAIQFERVTL